MQGFLPCESSGLYSEFEEELSALNINKVVKKSVTLSQGKPDMFRCKFRFEFRFHLP